MTKNNKIATKITAKLIYKTEISEKNLQLSLINLQVLHRLYPTTMESNLMNSIRIMWKILYYIISCFAKIYTVYMVDSRTLHQAYINLINRFMIFFLIETWLCEDIEYGLSGFNILNCDRNMFSSYKKMAGLSNIGRTFLPLVEN